jgi:hypothetical protein
MPDKTPCGDCLDDLQIGGKFAESTKKCGVADFATPHGRLKILVGAIGFEPTTP